MMRKLYRLLVAGIARGGRGGGIGRIGHGKNSFEINAASYDSGLNRQWKAAIAERRARGYGTCTATPLVLFAG